MESQHQAVSTVLVTGAAGYIGAVLVPALLERGYRVHALDRFFFGDDTLPRHPRLQSIREDTRCLTADHLLGVDAVIDLAAISNDPAGECFADATWAINHRARVESARLARSQGVKRYILPSSCSVYGFSEASLDESSPTAPLTHYARANKAAEDEILPLAGPGFTAVALRQATVFGVSPRMRFDLAINAMVHDAWSEGIIRLMRDGRQYRPFLHVADAADALCHFLEAPANTINGRIFNVGSADGARQLFGLAEELREFLEHRLARNIRIEWYGDPDHRSYQVDFSRIEREAGWQAGHSIIEGAAALADALEAGRVRRSPRTLTLDWYRRLEETRPARQALHGGILRICAAGR